MKCDQMVQFDRAVEYKWNISGRFWYLCTRQRIWLVIWPLYIISTELGRTWRARERERESSVKAVCCYVTRCLSLSEI